MPLLYTYFRSSSSYRVRIALNLKKIACDYHYINLKPGVSEQKSTRFSTLSPEARVPLWVDDDVKLSQSTAIIEYLEEKYPEYPLLPEGLAERAYVRQLVNLIACDVQPLNNIAVLEYLRESLSVKQDDIDLWYSAWILRGLEAFEALLERQNDNSDFCISDSPTMAEVYLIPQLWNARRFGISFAHCPRILGLEARCQQIESFVNASPEQQQDKQ